MDSAGAFTSDDVAMFDRAGIRVTTAIAAGWRRVTHAEARDMCGARYKSDHLEGIAFPYRDPITGAVVGYRVRRDHPELEADGTPIAKYLSSPDRRHLYFAPGCQAQLADASTPVYLVEAEKSALAVLDAEVGTGRRRGLPIALGGCWGWRGVIGKAESADGTRVDIKGALDDFDKVTWTNRPVVIAFDANAATNAKVRAARRRLAVELTRRGAHVHILELPVECGINGPDDFIGKHGAEAFMTLVDAALVAAINGDPDETAAKKSQATEIVEMVRASGVELWHTPNGDQFATVTVNGHREHHPLTRVMRDYVARDFFLKYGRAASSSALTDATATLGGMARFTGTEYPVAVRLAGHEESLYLDLGTADWQVIEITADGWSLTASSPVRHWRPRSLRPLPPPVPGGSLDALRTLWPNITTEAWTLVVAWLVSTLLPGRPYPILVFIGEQGSGKSTFGKMIRGLIDPASPALRGVPRDERDVVIGGATNYVVALDNLSGLPVWLSDALCRISTGGGFATRQLFTDADELTIDVTRPILLTGIDNPAGRGDLLDRALVVPLPAIPDHQRGDEDELWQRYEAMRPALLGALLDAAVCALRRRGEVTLDRKPRMADACLWVTAAEPALGWAPGTTVASWLGARQTASADLLADDPVAQALLSHLGSGAAWEGSSKGLLDELNGKATDATRRSKAWPTSPRGLSGALRRLAPDLRRAGVDIEFPGDHKRQGGTGQRVLRIVTTVTPSQSQENPGSSRDGRDGLTDAPGQPSQPTVTARSGNSGLFPAGRDGGDGRDGATPSRSADDDSERVA